MLLSLVSLLIVVVLISVLAIVALNLETCLFVFISCEM